MNFNSYLQSIRETYAQWWDCYTITDVVGKKRNQQKNLPPLLHNLMVETIKQDQGKTEEQEKTERLTVLEGLGKYAVNHVLLIGRPGSGKSTALLRLLLEIAQNYLEINFQANSESRLKTTESSTNSQFQLTSAMSERAARCAGSPRCSDCGGIDSLADSRENAKIPILIELRFYQTSIIDLIRDFLKRHQLWLEIPEIEKLLFEGQFVLLFDGVNELPSEPARQDLRKFRQDYQQTTPMIFTTRDLGVGGDLGIEKKLQMQPLTETQMRDFVSGYLPEQGEELLKQLSGRLRELGETPLLLMMLCSVFIDNQNKVPSNLGSVFRRFTEVYDNKLKQDIPVRDESRGWWKRLLQHLAWVMTHGKSKTEISVTIPIQEARDVLTRFLKDKDYHHPRNAETWLDDLLRYHLIQLGAENQIQFRHQLLQEYYAAERLLEELPRLSDDQLQWEYLNYLKWTEPVALMMQLLDDVETQNFAFMDLVKLALKVDLQLGARLAGEVREELQKDTIGLVDNLEVPVLLKIRLLGRTKSETAIPGLIQILEHQDSSVRSRAAFALGKIKPETAIPGLIQLLEDEDSFVRYSAGFALGEIKSETAIPGLIQLLEDEDSFVRDSAAEALGEIKSETAIPGLIKLLEDEHSSVRSRAAYALGEIKSETAITGLMKLLNNQNFLQLNNGENSLHTLYALEKIQEHLKYYKPIQKPTMSKSTSHNYALLIGVGECEETKLSLPVTVKDIQAIKTLLTDSNLCGYIDDNIRLLHNETATKKQILENLTWLKQQAENDPEATILIYYSGHGFLDNSLGNSQNYYLIPHDTDRADIPDTALPAETFNRALQQIPAQRLLVIIDSCHAQGMASSKDHTENHTEKNKHKAIPKGFTQTSLPKTIIDDLTKGKEKQPSGRVVFTSSTGTQSSWIRSDGKMSIYTYHLLEALQGAGNQPGDKLVKVSHLMNYLSETVPITVQKEYNKEQTPFFDFATEDFPVALLRGGKGLPEPGYESVKAEAQENIRNISNQVNDGVGILGNNNEFKQNTRDVTIHIDNSGDGNIDIGGVSSS